MTLKVFVHKWQQANDNKRTEDSHKKHDEWNHCIHIYATPDMQQMKLKL